MGFLFVSVFDFFLLFPRALSPQVHDTRCPRFLPLLLILLLLLLSPYAQPQSFEWVKEMKGGVKGQAVAQDFNGNVYVTGFFGEGTVSFDTVILISTGNTDIFVAKYDSTGKFLWVRQVGKPKDDSGLGISVDALGNCYVTGFMNKSLSPGTYFPNRAVFIAKYDPVGNSLWTKEVDGIFQDQGVAIATDIAGNSYITGLASDSLEFDSIHVYSEWAGSFITKLDSAGKYQWVKLITGADGRGISIDESGNSFITGCFLDTVKFDTITVTTPTYYYNIFLAKYDNSGNCLWVKTAGGKFSDFGRAVCNDSLGNVFITGTFQDTCRFESTVFTNYGQDDIFLAKYDNNGNFKWAKSAGGIANDRGHGVSADGNGNSYITGFFYQTARFSPSITATTYGDIDILAAKYDSSGNCLWVTHAGGALWNEVGNGISASENGYVYVTGNSRENAHFGNFIIANDAGILTKLTITATGVNDISDLPLNYSLSQNYPNPFNPTTVIRYQLPANSNVSLRLYDILGNEVATLVDEEQHAGTHEYKLSTLNYKLSSGIYFYQLRAGTFITTKKMLLLK